MEKQKANRLLGQPPLYIKKLLVPLILPMHAREDITVACVVFLSVLDMPSDQYILSSTNSSVGRLDANLSRVTGLAIGETDVQLLSTRNKTNQRMRYYKILILILRIEFESCDEDSHDDGPRGSAGVFR